MNRQSFPNRSQLIGLSVIAILALAFLLAVQAPAWTTFSGEAVGADAEVVDPLAGIHPADRKFFTDQYLPSNERQAAIQAAAEAADLKFQDPSYMESLMSQMRTDPLAGIHPADRKFFSGQYVSSDERQAAIQAAAEATDLKFQDASYMEFLMSQMRTDLLAGVHPADRKFYTDWAEWVGP